MKNCHGVLRDDAECTLHAQSSTEVAALNRPPPSLTVTRPDRLSRCQLIPLRWLQPSRRCTTEKAYTGWDPALLFITMPLRQPHAPLLLAGWLLRFAFASPLQVLPSTPDSGFLEMCVASTPSASRMRRGTPNKVLRCLGVVRCQSMERLQVYRQYLPIVLTRRSV